MTLPSEHPLRHRLFNEAHVRPYSDLKAPVQISHLALMTDDITAEMECEHLCLLAEQYGVAPPNMKATHYNITFKGITLKWAKHTEFSTYSFITTKQHEQAFSSKAIEGVADEWIKAIKGDLLVAQHIEIMSACDSLCIEEIVTEHFQQDSLVASFVGGTAAQAWTDFQLQNDGFSNILIFDESLTPQTTGRLVRHLLELETYRMLALLALPLVEKYGKPLREMGDRLTDITQRMSSTETLQEEHSLLGDLTALEASIEQIIASTSYRLSATRAYRSIVTDRVKRIRENRIEGRQMISRYLERRFEPAMNASKSITSMLESLSVHISRASQILMARINLAVESQNQKLLNSMDKRAKLQLRLQETVEGLSIAAVTFYVVSIMQYVADALRAVGVNIDTDIFVGASIPIVLLGVLLAARKIKKGIFK
ncbi:MAG TPA: DUF3422 family protein [Cycloclasticus sp.]|jgi:uncharacterized membrane-anchored protein|nr:DUF3422 family protein [Cycloclasticus sp.]HIL91842.1 DUF3422 family protein [Cycloclasticus sp.]